MKKLRFLAAVKAFGAVLLVALAHAGVQAGWHRLRRLLGNPSERAYRNRMDCWAAVWAPPVLWLTERAMDFRVEFRLPPQVQKGIPSPLCVTSNHVTLMDMLFIAVLLRRIGRRNVRWVMAEETRKSKTLIPLVCAEGGSVFIRRGDGGAAVDAIRACAARAADEGASMVIFPEGTRFRGPAKDSAFRHVLPPKVAGFAAMTEEMADCATLSLTMQWEGGAAGAGFSSAAAYAGRKLVIHGEYHEALRGAAAVAFLLDDFRRKEALLASGM